MIYTVYGREDCPLCVHALSQLVEHNQKVRFRNINSEKAKELLELYPMFFNPVYVDDIAMPIITCDDELVGGYVQMMEHVARHRVDDPTEAGIEEQYLSSP